MTPGDGLANDFWLAFRPALNLRNLGAIGERACHCREHLVSMLRSSQIGKDESDHVLSVGLTGADSLPVLVSLKVREREPARHLQSVLILFILRGAGLVAQDGERQRDDCQIGSRSPKLVQ